MLTTMFYYNHYKPYIFRAKETNNASNVKSKTNDKTKDVNSNKDAVSNEDSIDSKKLLLNKALKKDVVKYAHDVSYNLVSLKDSAKYINYDIEDFDYNTQKYGYSKARETLKDDLNNFVEAFNNSYNFYSSQVHSQSLVDFSVRTDNIINDNEGKLSELGINFDENRVLSFSDKKFDDLTTEELQASMEDSGDMFKGIYSESSSMLSVPLSEHMNFKGLNYYYNYKYGGVTADTFKIIESGMIIDIIA